MKQKLLTALLFCLVSSLAFSQIKPDIKLRFNGLGMLDPIFPTAQPGVEIKYGNFSVMYEHGFRSFEFIDKQPDSAHLRLNKNKIEFRYFTKNNSNRSISNYYALQFFNVNYSIDRWNSKYASASGSIDFDHAKERKQIKGIAISKGKVWQNGKRLSLDFNAGFGLRFVETRYIDLINPRKGDPRGGWTIFSVGRPDEEGYKTTIHLFTSLAICYQIF